VRWVHDNQTATSIPADFYNKSATYAYEAYAEWSYEPTVTLTLRGSATDPFSTAVEVREGVNAFAKYSIAVPAGDYETEDQRVHSFLGWYKTGTDLLVTDQYLENIEVDLDSTEIIKVGHHGSAYSTSLDFLQYLNVAMAVVSCGVNNPYGHPSKKMMANVDTAGAELYSTDTQGTVMISVKSADGYTVKTSK
jgi:hypothetical protein